jgi:hypothetical protein
LGAYLLSTRARDDARIGGNELGDPHLDGVLRAPQPDAKHAARAPQPEALSPDRLDVSGPIRDITTGNNGYYNAGVGYDLCTGVGVPNVTALLGASLTATAGLNVAGQLGNPS